MLVKFLFINSYGFYEEGVAAGVFDTRTCDAGVSVGDLVCESSTITNGVDKVVSNTDVRSVIGFVVNKPTTTTAEILLKGKISGLSGITKGYKVYLSSAGTFTSTKPQYGYLHVLGHAVDADTIDFDPVNIKIKLSAVLQLTGYTPFDPAKSSGDFTLLDNNYTVYFYGVGASAYTVTGHSSGKFYFEAMTDNDAAIYFEVVNYSPTLGIRYSTYDDAVMLNGTAQNTSNPISSNQWLGIAVDFDAQYITFYNATLGLVMWQGDSQLDPAQGPFYIRFSTGTSSTSTNYLNSGQNAFVMSPPSGYLPGFGPTS